MLFFVQSSTLCSNGLGDHRRLSELKALSLNFTRRVPSMVRIFSADEICLQPWRNVSIISPDASIEQRACACASQPAACTRVSRHLSISISISVDSRSPEPQVRKYRAAVLLHCCGQSNKNNLIAYDMHVVCMGIRRTRTIRCLIGWELLGGC
ncbi:hypothetical protein BDV19DRAFT_352989 [Aspergillus venezuelensis]